MRTLLIFLSSILALNILDAQSPVLRLTIQSQRDPTNSHPESRLYIAFAENVSVKSVYLPSAELAGGYAGKGMFYPCKVEVTAKNSKRWISIRDIKLQNVSGNRGPTYARLGPGERIEVCRALLPYEGGKRGELARFVLMRDWNVDAPPWTISNEFEIK